ncbi:MAG: efflux RND transporter permease subunit [Polyangiaceae bacterium]|nr:efflux RND transporter permease subunit [Polyangiaceae bacterium]
MNLADVSIRRPVFATMLIAALMVFGLISYPKVGVDLFPSVEFPFITVTVIYPGSDPETMEREVAEPIEEAVNTLGGIRSLRSINQEGVSFVLIEFELEVNQDKAMQDVRDKVARIQNDLPKAAEAPVVDKFDIGSAPIMTVALSGELAPREMFRVADKIVKEELQRVNGVGSVELVGGRNREIHVYLDPDRLSGYGLCVDDVASTIRAQNLEVPAGSYQSGTRDLTVKTKGQVESAQQIAELLLPGARGMVRVRDVAQVVDGIEDAESASFLDGEPAVSLSIKKQTGANTVAVAEAVKKSVASLLPRVEKAGARLTIANDTSDYIERTIKDVQFDILFGAALAVLVIFLFLVNVRATLISAIAIPTSLVATFAFIKVAGFTFNQMTMLAMSLAIGILVDDAIVVMENIHRHLEMGKPSMKAASEATAEIFLAVLAMTSTILAVFVPVAIMKGIVGRFFVQFGLTVSFAVAMSMLVSFTLTPMMSSRLLALTHEENRLAQWVDRGMSALERVYGTIIGWSLRYRLTTMGVAVAAFVASGALVSRVKTEFFPAEDRSLFSINVELPTGTALETTSAAAEAIAADLRRHIPGIKHALTTVSGGTQGQDNEATIRVTLVDTKHRKHSQQQIMNWARARYGKIPDVTTTVQEAGIIEGGGHAQPVQYLVMGDKMDELIAVSDHLKQKLEHRKGFVDVETSYRGGKPEIDIEVDRERAAALGVPVASIASTIRTLLAGDAVSDLKSGADAYDITLQLPPDERSRIASLSGLKVRSVTGQVVDLSNVVRVKRTSGPNKIERMNRQRQITLFANLDGLVLGEAKGIVDREAAQVVPPDVNTRHEGMGRIMTESFGYMFEALILAVVLVYMILAAQFNSFSQPITVMMSLPLSVIGAFGALYLSGMTLSMMSMIGIIMLMGIVTKNAILLVDFANQQRERGADMFEALITAGKLRLRPILMTSVAMIFGMLPVALALGEGGAMRAPMGVCVIGGLITSTLLTLVIVPVFYSYVEQLVGSRWMKWMGGKLFRSMHPPAAQEAAGK